MERIKLFSCNRKTTTAGITLIALIITVIVLLILTGISIATLTGDNGLLTKAIESKITTEIASIKEEIQTEILREPVGNKGNISNDRLEQILLTYGDLSEEKKLIDKTLTTTEGQYKIKVSDIIDGIVDVEDVVEPFELPEWMGGANAPDISGFNCKTTKYVTWVTTYNPDDPGDPNGSYDPNGPYQKIQEEITIDNPPPDNWVNYDVSQKRWANIKTTGGGNECYWVWIPRFAYKVPSKPTTSKPEAETIEVELLEGLSGPGFNPNPRPGDWVTHPAFTDEGNGGLGELTGFWVAKFEASSNVAEDLVDEFGHWYNDVRSVIANDGGSGADTDLKVRVKPNVTSWRGITVNNIFKVCRNLTKPGNSLEKTSETLDSHMMKNTEWGAVAYLSMSCFGKNSEVWNNPFYLDENNYSPITGLCGTSENEATTSLNGCFKYDEHEGKNASTSGTVFGVYDMAGGAWEYVAGLPGGLKKTSKYDFSDEKEYPSKYFDWYQLYGTRKDSYYRNSSKYGDAMYETSYSGDSYSDSWNASNSQYFFREQPVFERGGRAFDESYADIFAFHSMGGEALPYDSFRPVVINPR